MKLSGGRMTPADYERKEYWTWNPPGAKPWIKKALHKCMLWTTAGKGSNSALSLDSRDGNRVVEQRRFPVPPTETTGSKGVR